MEQTSPLTASPKDLLARNAFGFAILALIPLGLTCGAFLLSPVSPDPTYAQLRGVIILVSGVLVLAWLALCVWIFRTPPEKLPVTLLTRLLTMPKLMMVLTVGLIFINLLAMQALYSVAPAFVLPARFLLAFSSLIFVAFVGVVNTSALKRWWSQTRNGWGMVGLIATTLLVIGLIAFGNHLILQASHLDDRIRGGLDYRSFAFHDDGTAVDAARYRIELAQMRVRWLPYSYWTVGAFSGTYINVSSQGLRSTPHIAIADEAQTVAFFGGSTLWGEGARDAYTIPSILASQFPDLHMVNYGQTGYVSTQDMILFQMQLAQNTLPNVAVFYGGFNDLLSANIQGVTGVSLQEDQRISDVEAGRVLRSGLPLLRPLNSPVNPESLSLVANANAQPEAIVERWLANRRMIRALAAEYNVRVLFVWQPFLNFKQPMTDSEQQILTGMATNYKGLSETIIAADQIIREKAKAEAWDDVLILSDLFKDEPRTTFLDLIHITEEGNIAVAQAIQPALKALLPKN